MAFSSLPRRHAWHAAPAALLALVLAMTAVPGAHAEVRAGEDGTTGALAALPSVVVSPTAPVLGEPGEDAIFTIVVRNPGPDPLSGGDITLEVNPQRVETVAGLDEEFPVTGATIAESRIGETAAGTEQTISVTVAREDLPFTALTAAGVYQLRGTLTLDPESEPLIPDFAEESAAPSTTADDAQTGTPDAGTTGEDESASADADADELELKSPITPIVWRGSGGSEVKLSVIVPLVLPTDIRTVPTRDQLSDAIPKLDRLLTAATAQQATLAIDPRIIAGIRAYGAESPLAAQTFLARLESSSLPSFLLQFADADPAAQAALGFTTLLEPTNLDFVSRFGTFPATAPTDEDAGGAGAGGAEATAAPNKTAPGTTVTPTPTPEPSGDVTLPPTLKELLAWSEETPMAWPAEGSVDEGTVELLQANGISSLVLTSENVSQEGGPRVTIDGGSALITDTALGDAADRALSATNDTERSAARSELAARLALAAQTDVPGAVIGLDRGAVADAEDPAQLLDELGELDWVSSTPHTEQRSGTASLKSADTLEDRRELLRTAVNRESAVDEVGAILVHPEYLSGYQRTRLLDLFATRYAASDMDFPEAAAVFRKRDAELMEGVRAVSTEHTQLVGASTRVPVQLRNSLPFEALVSVRVDPASAALLVTEREFSDIRVRPESTERLLVPVQSRVSSGESGLVVSISDASGDLTIYTGTLSISIRSAVETIALWGLGVLAALLLGFGIWRSVRRRRHRPKIAASPES